MDLAQGAFNKAIQANPQHASAHLNLGFVVEQSGRTKEALALYEKAAQLQPALRLAHFHAGRLLTNARAYAQAIAHFQKTLVPEDGETPGFLYALGIAYGRSGEAAAARQSLQRALDMPVIASQPELAAAIRRDLQTLGARR
jgi:tetratricopeptide (TPR) repeat protein